MECAFRCRQQLKRKRALVDCDHCNETVVCCLECAQLYDVCLPCEPQARLEKHKEAIWEIVLRARESGCAFSDTNYQDLNGELWATFSRSVVVNAVTVQLDMGGRHSVDDNYHIRAAHMGCFNQISVKSAPVVVDQEKLRTWAADFKFNKDELMEVLQYEPDSIACGGWSGEYTIYVYTFDKEAYLRKKVDSDGFAFCTTRYPIQHSATLSIDYEEVFDDSDHVQSTNWEARVAQITDATSEVPKHVLEHAAARASDFYQPFTLYAYWKSSQ